MSGITQRAEAEARDRQENGDELWAFSAVETQEAARRSFVLGAEWAVSLTAPTTDPEPGSANHGQQSECGSSAPAGTSAPARPTTEGGVWGSYVEYLRLLEAQISGAERSAS